MLAFAAAYFFCGLAILFSRAIFALFLPWSAMACGVLFVVGMLFLVSGIYSRQKLDIPVRLLLMIAVLGLGSSIAAAILSETINMRIVLFNGTIGILFMVAAVAVYLQQQKNSVEWLLLVVLGFICVEMFIFPHITLHFDGELQLSEVAGSLHQTVLNLVLSISMLLLALSLIAISVHDIIAEIRMNSQLDDLTSALNRGTFQFTAEAQIERAVRDGRPVSLIVADLDHFKSINDKHGHLAGDAVLSCFGAILRNSVRKTDFVGRVGGEEFAILLLDAEENDAYRIAVNLCVCFAANPVQIKRRVLSCTASFGVATALQHEDYSSLFEKADRALYAAKAAGRNRVCCDDREIRVKHRQLEKRRSLINDKAVAKG